MKHLRRSDSALPLMSCSELLYLTEMGQAVTKIAVLQKGHHISTWTKSDIIFTCQMLSTAEKKA